MGAEPATILVLVLSILVFFLFVLPLVIVLRNLRAVWRDDRSMGLLLTGIILLTGLASILFFGGMFVIIAVYG
jgi:hypothetical protein